MALKIFKNKGEPNAIPINAENLNFNFTDLNNRSISESGSNESGSWIKFNDGTMIINQKYISEPKITVVTMGNLKRVGLSEPPNFPVPFIEPPIVHITLHNCWLAWLMGCEYTPTSTNATNNGLIPIASVDQKTMENVEINITAFGKWK